MDFLNLQGKCIVVFGVANRKSVAWHIGQTLEAAGAHVLYSVRSEKRRQSLTTLLEDRPVFLCDVEHPEEIAALAGAIGRDFPQVDGIVHAIAFANYAKGVVPFHETERGDFLQATAISSFSLVEIARAFKPFLTHTAAVVTISISSTDVVAESYGYMSPIKATLDGTVRHLAKSFSRDTHVRFNAVSSGPLKTSASAGIPGFLDNYLYAEKLTLRRQAVQTQEVANAAVFLLSDRSSGINGQQIVVNAGMDFNYFDQAIVKAATRSEWMT